MQPHNQNPNEQLNDRVGERVGDRDLEQVINAGLATFPVEPLPTDFTKSVMAAITNEPVIETTIETGVETTIEPVPAAPF